VKYKSTLRDSYCCETVILEIHHYFYNGPSLKDTGASYNTAELSGESRSANPVELPGASGYIPYSRKYASDRVFPVSEGLPPLVNKITKPTLQS